MLAYTQLAISLINMVYRSSDPGNLKKSLLGVVTGSILMLFTFLPFFENYFKTRLSVFFWSAISLIAILTAII